MNDRELPDLDPAIVDQVCKKHGIRTDDRFLVLALLERPTSRWPGCCGSGCTPCMEDVIAAALELKR